MIYDYDIRNKVCNKFEGIVKVAIESGKIEDIKSYMPDNSRLFNGINDSGVIIQFENGLGISLIDENSLVYSLDTFENARAVEESEIETLTVKLYNVGEDISDESKGHYLGEFNICQSLSIMEDVIKGLGIEDLQKDDGGLGL